MRKYILVLTLVLAACSMTNSLAEFGVDNKKCIGVLKCKLL